MQHLAMRYSQQNMHVASHITCLRATSIEIMDRWHATLRPYQEYCSHTGRCEGDIMKGLLQLNKLTPPVARDSTRDHQVSRPALNLQRYLGSSTSINKGRLIGSAGCVNYFTPKIYYVDVSF